MRVLIVEDHPELGAYTAEGLRQSGFVSDLVQDLGEAEAALAAGRFDAMVLDLGLPDGDGLSWLMQQRRQGLSLPVVVLTARDALDDRLKGLDGGADDYVVKPAALAEIAARLRAILRRGGQPQPSQLIAGNLAFDTTSREVSIAGQALPLSRRDIDILEILIRRFGRVVPRELIEDGIFSFDDVAGPNALEVSMHRLRKRLAQAGAGVAIHTLRGIGYLLQAEEA